MHIENERDGYLWSNKDKQSFHWIITCPCLFLFHEIKWHLLYLIEWQSIFFLSRMTCLYCERSWRNNYSRRGFNVHLLTNIKAKPQRNQGVVIFKERDGLMQMGRYHFQILWTPPLSVFKRHFWRNNKKPSQNSEGYLSWIKNWFQPSFILNKSIDLMGNLSQEITCSYHIDEDSIVSISFQPECIVICNLNQIIKQSMK